MAILKDFVVPVLVGLVVGIAITVFAGRKFDVQERVYLLFALCFAALFVSRWVQLHNRQPLPKQTRPAIQTGNATTSGPESPAITGSGNKISYGQAPNPGKGNPKKKSDGRKVSQ